MPCRRAAVKVQSKLTWMMQLNGRIAIGFGAVLDVGKNEFIPMRLITEMRQRLWTTELLHLLQLGVEKHIKK